jgi:hypothetical protein
MGPKQKGGGGSTAGGGGPASRQKGNNATEEVEETLQAVVRGDLVSAELWRFIVSDGLRTINRLLRIFLKQNLNL